MTSPRMVLSWMQTRCSELSPTDRVRLVLAVSGFDQVAIATSFGPSSAVLLQIVSQVCPSIRVIHIDTGHETSATKKFAEKCARCFPIQVIRRVVERREVPPEGTLEFEEFFS